MKNYLPFVIAVLITTNSIAQNCLENDISFLSQSEIDNFVLDYPNCTAINVNVTIGGTDEFIGYIETDIKNLEALANIKSISGSLRILGNDSLISLLGLRNLNRVDGNLVIESNSKLVNLEGLDSLTSFGKKIIISIIITSQVCRD